MVRRHLRGFLTAYAQGCRACARWLGTASGIVALLLQCLVFTVHQPALAAAPTPFGNPAVWCGMPKTAPQNMPAKGKTPLDRDLPCPICQTMQAADAGLAPPPILLVLPAFREFLIPPASDRPAPAAPHTDHPSPRGPPNLL
jgi:hypothetical protein